MINNDFNLLNNFENDVMLVLRLAGQLGNAIFIFCSSWFLCNKHTIKNIKIVYLLCDSTICLVIVFALFYFISFTNDFKLIIYCFPLFSSYNWFIRAYCIFYLIVPYLNIIISNIDKKSHFNIVMVLSVIYSLGNMIKYGLYYYNHIIGFILIYFIASYIKMYNIQIIEKLRFNILLILLGSIFSLLIIFNHMPFDNYGIFFVNPFVLMIVCGLFGMFSRNINFISKKINYISSLSLLIYVFHENYYIDIYFKNSILNFLSKSISNNFGLIIIYFIILFMYSFVLSNIYSLAIMPWIHKGIDLISLKVMKLYNKKNEF